MMRVMTASRMALDPAIKSRDDTHSLSCRGVTTASRATRACLSEGCDHA
jgi:hypothetical protein